MAVRSISLANRYEALDSLRGVSACVVALFHFHTTGVITNLPIVIQGWMCVDFFFVLSGFVIASAYFHRMVDGFSGWRFMALRLGRIYPLHLFLLLLFFVMELAVSHLGSAAAVSRDSFGPGRSLPDFAAATTFLNAFGLSDRLGVNAPSWSIGAEFWVYALFAVTLATAGRRSMVVFCVLAVAALLWLVLRSPDGLATSYQYGFIRCLYGFAIGVVTERVLHRHREEGRLMLGGSGPELAVAAVAILFVCFSAGYAVYAAPLVFALVIAVFAFEAGVVSRLLRTRPMLMLGTLSYSIYMTHIFIEGRFANVLKVIGHRVGQNWVTANGAVDNQISLPAPFADLATVVLLLLTIGVSWVTYRWIEQPGRDLTRRWVSGARQKNTARAEVQASTF